MRLSKIDPEKCRNKLLLLHRPGTHENSYSEQKENAEVILAYCYLDPIRGYRLLLCARVIPHPFHVCDELIYNQNVSYASMYSCHVKRCQAEPKDLSLAIQKMIRNSRAANLDGLLYVLSRMDLDGWKVMKTERMSDR